MAVEITRELLEQIDQICNESSFPNWGNEGEIPISLDVCRRAKEFVKNLNSVFDINTETRPDPYPEHDGAIAMEFFHGKNHRLDISFEKDNTVIFVGRIDGNQVLGKTNDAEIVAKANEFLRQIYR
jgi:hypothetical protein